MWRPFPRSWIADGQAAFWGPFAAPGARAVPADRELAGRIWRPQADVLAQAIFDRVRASRD